MTEQAEHKPSEAEIEAAIEMEIKNAKTASGFWFRGKESEIEHEMKELEPLSNSTQPHRGEIIRKPREMHHLETRQSDLAEAQGLFNELLDDLLGDIRDSIHKVMHPEKEKGK